MILYRLNSKQPTVLEDGLCYLWVSQLVTAPSVEPDPTLPAKVIPLQKLKIKEHYNHQKHIA